jgi:hypothetical protein
MICTARQQRALARYIYIGLGNRSDPTILRLLGLDPQSLDAVRIEGTRVLPGL